RDASERRQLRATTPLRVHLVGGGERFALMYTEEGARTFTLRVFDCRERLFDELAAGDFLAGKELGKFDDGHRAEFMSSPTLCENRLDAPKRCAGKSKPAQAGRVLQKASTLLIHVCSSSL